MNLQNPPAGYLAVSKGHPGEAAPEKLNEYEYHTPSVFVSKFCIFYYYKMMK